MEKARLPSPAEHPSFQRHRRELWTKILAPLLIAAGLILALSAWIGVAAFRGQADVGRWAAISAIWIVIPVICAGVIVLAIFLGLVYGMARLLQVIPPYTGYAQRVVWRVQGYVKRGADLAVRPILGLEGILAAFRRLFGWK
ncbi:MAG: hypothetical protein AB1750_02340 [Chloroflexota bacterium]